MAQQELIAPRREDALVRLLFGEAMERDEPDLPVSKYSEDQPRDDDDNGRFGEGGGAASGGVGGNVGSTAEAAALAELDAAQAEVQAYCRGVPIEEAPVPISKPVGKAAPDPFWRRLHAIADKAEPKLRQAILAAIAKTVSGVDAAALERALTSGNLNAAMKAIPWNETGEPALRAAYRAILTDTYDRAGEATAEVTGRKFGASISFDLENPRATAWASTVAATRVVEVSEGTVAAIRSIVSRGFKEGIAPREMARLIRGPKDSETGQYRSSVIGLTEQQANAVYNYRNTLQNDNIERSTEREDRMVERYRDQLVLHRAETISRTETMTASNEGQQESWKQAVEQGLLRGNERREWIVTEDDRLCPYCEAMEGQRVGLDEPFFSEDEGEIMVPPLHPNCRCAMGLVEAPSSTEEPA